MEKRILIVEDDTPIREMIRQLLGEIGYDVVSVGNGVDALRMLHEDAGFDLMLLDMGLPLMDGWELARRMHADGLNIPIVVMTAGRDAQRSAEEVGAVGYIGKPFDIEEMEHSVQRALGDPDIDPRHAITLPPIARPESYRLPGWWPRNQMTPA